MGRKTEYEPRFCDLLLEHMTAGGDFRSFAGILGVSRSTLYNWVARFPEFSEAKEIATEKAYAWWEEKGRSGLWIHREGPNLNAGHWIRNMVSRFPDDWRTERPDKGDAPTGDDAKAILDAAKILKELE